jgi:hypothetical protein
MSMNERGIMADLKELAEGTPLSDAYTLRHWIGQDGTGTFFAAVTGEGERVLVKLASAHDPGAERQFATWDRSRGLRHPHLLELRDVGSSELAGSPYVYAVFEYPDDVLASAVDKGPLSEAETRGVLEAALAALSYLHAQGLVHGAVTPDQIVAVGDSVKLATDALRESHSPEAQAEDVRQLGELVRGLRAPEPLTDPLATVVRRATAKDLRKRWTLAEIAGAIAPPSAAAAVTVTPVIAAPARSGETDAPPAGGFPRWIIAGVAILLFVILLFNIRPKPEAPRTATPAPAPAPVQASPPPAPVLAERSVPAARKAAPSSPAIWRVVAFTYRARDMASKKVKQINDRWPDLHATVFRPKSLPGYFLVALGDRMTREDAVRLQRKARSMGLPRDTFVQNYND